MLEITKTIDGTTMNVALVGRLDTDTAGDYEDQVLDNLEGMTSVTLDMAGVTYVSSAGLRALLMTAKALSDRELIVKSVTPAVREIFDMTGIIDLFRLE